MKLSFPVRFVCVFTIAMFGILRAEAQTNIWDGSALPDNTWTNQLNWIGDTLPLFDGTENIVITNTFGTSGTVRTNNLAGNYYIRSLQFGDSSSSYQRALVGGTLFLKSGQLYSRSSDSTATRYYADLVLSNGAAGSYTADWRELNNSSGGAHIHGAITQASGENWTIEFRQNSSRGAFFLLNTGNNVSEFRAVNTTVFFGVNGAQGSGNIKLTLAGGTFAFTADEFYDTPFDENFTLTAGSGLRADIRTRITGTITQGVHQLTYSGASLLRLENTAMTASDTGNTLIGGSSGGATVVSPASMAQFASGRIDLNNARAVLVLSGAAGNGVPTWADFVAARDWNQSGGANTWRITAGGGFAALGADLIIPRDSETTAATFARDFTLGTAFSTGGVRYANHAIRIEQDINLPVTSTNAPMRWYMIGGKISDSATNWSLGGPIHEIAGHITGGSISNRLALAGSGDSNSGQAGLIGGMIRFSNPTNAMVLKDLYIGTDRTLPNFGAADDASGLVAIFTSDGAFGTVSNVEVVAGGDSARVANLLLFEDTASGTTFGRNFSIQGSGSTSRQSGFGSYAGSVTYTGQTTLLNGGANDNALPIHVESGTLTLSGATLQNDRTSATASFSLNKGGAGTLVITSLTHTGARTAVNPTNNWDVWQGKLIWNATDSGGAVLNDFDVWAGATLGGNGIINIGANTLTLNGTAVNPATLAPGTSLGTLTVTGAVNFVNYANLAIELGGGSADKLVVSGALNLSSLNDKLVLTSLGFVPNGTYTIVEYGSLANFGNISSNLWQFGIIDATGLVGSPTYTVDYGTGVNSAITLTIIPEPSALALVGVGLIGLLAFRRRR
jgi:hypothetical protein